MSGHIMNPDKAMNALEDGVLGAIKDTFPITGKTNTLVLDNIYTSDRQGANDLTSQKKARMMGRTWSSSVFGDFRLIDNKTQKVIDTKKVKILNMPNLTKRYSFIVGGTEYQVDNLWRLKSGVYTRIKADGELETQFNLAKGRGFRMTFDPIRKNFLLSYHTTNVPLVSALEAVGVTKEEMVSSW